MNMETERVSAPYVTALVIGRFNIVHPGHIRLFSFARQYCKKLVVGLYVHDESSEIRPRSKRKEELRRIEHVDSVIEYSDFQSLIGKIKPDVIFGGHDFAQSHTEETSLIRSLGIKLVCMSSDTQYHNQVKRSKRPEAIDSYERDYCSRHGISTSGLTVALRKAADLKCVVIGEVIIDEFIPCEAIGMSQEDKNIVYAIGQPKSYLGGAGIVATHCAGLGVNTTFVSALGADSDSDFAIRELRRAKVEISPIIDRLRRSLRKTRFIADQRPIFRASQVDAHIIDEEVKAKILEKARAEFPSCDFIIFSDFNYGILPKDLVEQLIKIAKEVGVFVAADCQISSQEGDLSKYFGVDLLVPTEYEARATLNDFDCGVASLGRQLKQKLNIGKLILTLGEAGLLVFGDDSSGIEVERLGAFSKYALDTSGAGDSLLSVSTIVLASGGSLYEAAYFGSVAAGIQVMRRGNTALSPCFWEGIPEQA